MLGNQETTHTQNANSKDKDVEMDKWQDKKELKIKMNAGKSTEMVCLLSVTKTNDGIMAVGTTEKG